MLDMLQVGVITTTHGLKGEVKVFLTSDDPKRFDTLDEVILVEGARSRPLSIEHVKYFKGRPILKFKGLDRIEDVERVFHRGPDRMYLLSGGRDRARRARGRSADWRERCVCGKEEGREGSSDPENRRLCKRACAGRGQDHCASSAGDLILISDADFPWRKS